MEIKFNKQKRSERIQEQTSKALEKIKTNWDNGISPVDLISDTDIFKEVKEEIFKSVPEAKLTRLTSKAYSQNTKNNTTVFRVVYKENSQYMIEIHWMWLPLIFTILLGIITWFFNWIGLYDIEDFFSHIFKLCLAISIILYVLYGMVWLYVLIANNIKITT